MVGDLRGAFCEACSLSSIESPWGINKSEVSYYSIVIITSDLLYEIGNFDK